MKWLLARIGLPKAIGLYVDEDTITLSRVVATPLGPVEITRQSEARGDEGLAEVLGRMVKPLLGKRKLRRVPVSVGIPARRIYFSTRPVHASTGDSSPHVLLREALRSPNASVNDMVVDVVKTEPDSRAVASIAACDKTYLGEVLDALATLEIRPSRIEPAPCSLLRLAAGRHRTRRGDKVVLRLFLSNTQVLAILVVNRMPLLWRFTQLPQGDEASAVLTACRSLLTTSKDCGVESPLDAVMIHGREELKRLVDVGWVEQQLDASIDWFGEPSLDSSWIASGLAQGGFDKSEAGFDLARSLKPRPKLMQLFPWREAIMQGALLACMAALLGYTYWTRLESQRNLQTLAAASPTEMRAKKRELEAEKKRMEEQLQAVQEFLGSRVLWTTCLRDITACVPDDMYLTSVRGVCELRNMRKQRGSSKLKKSLVLRGAVVIPPSGLVPREIDRLLTALRSDPMLRREFPSITLDELKRIIPQGSDMPTTIFSVVCLPKEQNSPAAAAPGAAKKDGKGKK